MNTTPRYLYDATIGTICVMAVVSGFMCISERGAVAGALFVLRKSIRATLSIQIKSATWPFYHVFEFGVAFVEGVGDREEHGFIYKS